MDKPSELEQQIGQFLNQQSADLTILKVTLQILIWNLVRRDQNALGALGHLRDEVLASLYKTTSGSLPTGPGATEAQRLRQLTLVRAEKLFQDIERQLSGQLPGQGSGKTGTQASGAS